MYTKTRAKFAAHLLRFPEDYEETADEFVKVADAARRTKVDEHQEKLEEIMRPYVDKAQEIVDEMDRLRAWAGRALDEKDEEK